MINHKLLFHHPAGQLLKILKTKYYCNYKNKINCVGNINRENLIPPQELHRLPSEARTYFKILCYVFKCIHGLAPLYLSELLIIKQHQDLTLQIPRTFSTYGDRAFYSAGPKLWNSLPQEIRFVKSLDGFKSKLKHYFFNSFLEFKAKLNMYT